MTRTICLCKIRTKTGTRRTLTYLFQLWRIIDIPPVIKRRKSVLPCCTHRPLHDLAGTHWSLPSDSLTACGNRLGHEKRWVAAATAGSTVSLGISTSFCWSFWAAKPQNTCLCPVSWVLYSRSELIHDYLHICVQCDECFIQEVNEALQHWPLPL